MRETYLREALIQARKACELDEVPIGCVVVKDNEVIASAHNLTETTADPTAHAEILAIRIASEVLGTWRLEECSLYVTLEPCIMCTYALILSRVKEVVFGALDERHGGVMSLYNLLDDPRLNHRVRWVYHPLEECSAILTDFFRKKRCS